MSEDQLYELARRRIDRRNRRWILWGADFLAFLVFIGAFVTFKTENPGVHNLGVFIALAWVGVLCLHGVIISMTQNRDQEIESEVARLRQAIYDEKPKRLELSDDGELTDFADAPRQSADKARKDSV